MIASVEHRPYPPPENPWVGAMVWHDLLFAHWEVPAEALRRVLPEALPLDTYEGKAYVGVVPFHMTGVRARGVPAIPYLSAFPEINVRTYVTIDGRPGVYFFSLDVTNPAAVAGARLTFFLPYFLASMSVTTEGGWTHYSSHRSQWHGSPAHFIGRYRPVGEAFRAAPGSLEHWLTDRYCLYTTNPRGEPYRVEIHHGPWPLQPAEASIFRNTMAAPLGIDLPDAPPLLHFAQRMEVAFWLPTRLQPGA